MKFKWLYESFCVGFYKDPIGFPKFMEWDSIENLGTPLEPS